MELVEVRELYRNKDQYIGKRISVGGWIRSVRDLKTFGFIVLHDGTCFNTLQVVYHDKLDNFVEISKLNVGSAIIVTGELVATPQAKQPFEIQADQVVVEGYLNTGISPSEKETLLRIFKNNNSPKTQNQYISGSISCPFTYILCNS